MQENAVSNNAFFKALRCTIVLSRFFYLVLSGGSCLGKERDKVL